MFRGRTARAVSIGRLQSAVPIAKLLRVYTNIKALGRLLSTDLFLPPRPTLFAFKEAILSTVAKYPHAWGHKNGSKHICPVCGYGNAAPRDDSRLCPHDGLCDPPLWFYHHHSRWGEWEQAILFFQVPLFTIALLQVRLIWPGILTFPKCLYYINRYLSIALSLYCVSTPFYVPLNALFSTTFSTVAVNVRSFYFHPTARIFDLLDAIRCSFFSFLYSFILMWVTKLSRFAPIHRVDWHDHNNGGNRWELSLSWHFRVISLNNWQYCSAYVFTRYTFKSDGLNCWCGSAFFSFTACAISFTSMVS